MNSLRYTLFSYVKIPSQKTNKHINYVQYRKKKKKANESYLRNNKHDLRIISMRSDCLALSSLQP